MFHELHRQFEWPGRNKDNDSVNLLPDSGTCDWAVRHAGYGLVAKSHWESTWQAPVF